MAKVFIWARAMQVLTCYGITSQIIRGRTTKNIPGCRGTILTQMKKTIFKESITGGNEKIMFGAAGFDLICEW